MLLNDLRKHRKLADKRHPMFESNRFGKFFIYFGIIFWVAYLIFFGMMFPAMFEELFPNMEPYHILNKGLMYLLPADFLIRFIFQKTPAQEMKPYLLLPIGKKKLLNTYLIQSGLNPYNLFWLVMILPFSFLTILPFYGITGIVSYCVGIWLLMVFNNYWYLLCKTLINEKTVYILLPLIVYGALGVTEFTLGHPVSTFTMNLGEGYITGNIGAFAGTLVAILVMAAINRQVQMHLLYSELSKIKDTKVKHVSEYKFLERYGEVGEYLRLELKLLFRNKRCKSQFRMGCILIVFFNLALFGDLYTGITGQSFVLTYNYAVLGILLLSQLMSFEGNYLDGLMSRKESIYNLLRAKYYFYSLATLIPFILSLPAVFMGKITLLASLSYMFLTIGFIYWLLFQLAVYNKKTVAMNDGMMGKNSGSTFFQSLITILAFVSPMILNSILVVVFNEVTAQWIFLFTGIALMLTSPWWIRNVYKRFMKRRYRNMEGFRDSK